MVTFSERKTEEERKKPHQLSVQQVIGQKKEMYNSQKKKCNGQSIHPSKFSESS